MKLKVYGMRFTLLRRNVRGIASVIIFIVVTFYGYNEYLNTEKVIQNNSRRVSYNETTDYNKTDVVSNHTEHVDTNEWIHRLAHSRFELKQLRVYALLSVSPNILDITDKLFVLLESGRDIEQFEMIRLAFETLVLDLWNFYQNNTDQPRRGVSRYSWETDRERKHLINCSNIQTLTYRRSMGSGFVKSVYLADLQGTTVVVKVKNLNIINKRCYDKFQCAVERDIRILNELILLGGLRHPMFNTLLGFCIHSGFESLGLLAIPGVVAVYEAGKPINWDKLAPSVTFKDALRQSMAFAEFLDYAEHSPFGRLTLIDLYTYQFVAIDTYFSLADMDLTTNVQDPVCNAVKTELKPYRGYPTKMCVFPPTQNIRYSFEVPCVRGKCLHMGQTHNMKRINDFVFMRIFDFSRIPERLHEDIKRILTEIRWYLPAAKLYTELEEVLAKYTIEYNK